jgi:stearoyl-CoA desaturase (delta-9 desaturase)
MSELPASGARTGGAGARPAPRVTIRNDALRPKQQRIALLTILGPTAGTILAVGLALWRGFTRLDLAFLAGGIVLGQLFLEVGFHRLLAHRAFETHRWMRTLLAIGGSLTGQGRVTHWVANHRRHHVHSDTPDDPHSPYVRARRDAPGAEPLGLVRGLVHAQWGHMLTDDVPNCTLFARDLNVDPALRKVNEHYGLILWAGLLLPALIGLWVTGAPAGALSGFLWGGLVRMFVVQNVTWSVASASHRFGSAPFDTRDESRNLIWTALPSFGSGYQNNHHAFPHSAFLGLRWWELDVGAWAIRGLARLGLAWDLKRPAEGELRAKRRSKLVSTAGRGA